MAMSGGPTIQAQADLVRTTIAYAKQLTVDRLKRVLKSESLQVSGVKSELQTRLIAHIYDCDRRNDCEHLQRIQNAVRNYYPGTAASSSTALYNSSSLPNPYPSPYSNHTPASSASPQNYYTSPTPRLPPPSINMPSMSFGSRLTFKTSPFYSIQRALGPIMELRPRENTRDTAKMTVTLDAHLEERFRDPLCRAMVFCAAEAYDNAWKPVDIAFPHHAELRCNSEDIKTNLKGLKNKPGSTRPVDITPFLRKRQAYPNSVELVYALTNKDKTQKYLLLVNMVHKRTIQSLVGDLKKGKYLSKERVIREMQARADDDDIVATSSNMSLKDPVQMTRIETPCRSMSCKHNECFDAAVFLELQEQAPTWTCPICSKPATWEDLVYDLFVQDILSNTKRGVDQVTIEPSGAWHLIKEEDNEDDRDNPFIKHRDSDDEEADDDNDDIVEIVDPDASKTMTSIRTKPSSDSIGTPPLNGRTSFSQNGGFSSMSNPQPASQSKKRPREDNVIDLTLSDDDEPPVSRIKRPSLGSQISDSSRLGVPSSGPFRFTLPPPIPSRNGTDSPTNGYSPGMFTDYDRLYTRL